jgi:predicted PurR-regulated permease PerM
MKTIGCGIVFLLVILVIFGVALAPILFAEEYAEYQQQRIDQLQAEKERLEQLVNHLLQAPHTYESLLQQRVDALEQQTIFEQQLILAVTILFGVVLGFLMVSLILSKSLAALRSPQRKGTRPSASTQLAARQNQGRKAS